MKRSWDWRHRVSVVLLVTLTSCSKSPPPPQPPPPQVTVSRPVEREVIEWDEYSGYLSSPVTSNVVARVSGLIVDAAFREGAIVRAGQQLYKIDPRPFEADLDARKADLAKAQAQQDLAQATLNRLAAVRGTRAISEESFDQARADLAQAKAAVEAAKAALETSQLNLEWTTVTAPIGGRISRKYVTVGNLVNGGSGQATLLTTIVSIDPIYCYINIPEATALGYKQIAIEEKHTHVADARVPCFVKLENETRFEHPGMIDFVDNQIDTSTGTVQVRGVFSNPTGLLMPGLFALMRIPATGRYKAILIPDAAVNTDQNERYLLIVGPENIVQRRPVKLGAVFGALRVIVEGLKPGERVIVEGVQFARPGAKVIPHEVPVSPESLDKLEAMIAPSPATRMIPQTRPATAPSTRPVAEGTP